ncbi:MAG: universal stress protein [Burkholderiales bacterium]
MIVLLPADGSDGAKRAAEWVSANRRDAELHILNVQLPVASGGVKMFISEDSLNDYYRDEALAALKPVRDLLDSNNVKYEHHIGVGDEAETIVRFAKEQHCDEIVIAKSDPGFWKFGSVSRKVIQLSPIRVVVIP